MIGHGGVSQVRRACGLSRKAIAKGIREIAAGAPLADWRIRRPGAGRKPITVSDPRMLETLDALVDPDSRGDPQSPLRWTCKSTRTLARELGRRQHPIDHTTVARLLHDLGYRLQSNRKPRKATTIPTATRSFVTSRRP